MSSIVFCEDGELGYERSRTRLAAGQALSFDESYRVAHLPLVAPDHPDVIAARDGSFYDRGRHPKVYSVALPIPGNDLLAAPAFADLDRELRAAPFAAKIAWDLMARRRERLHATVCGSLAVGEGAAAPITSAQRKDLLGLGPIHVELRGLFSGNVNTGRLYLRVYPQRRNGENLLRRVQRALGGRETDLYVVGLYNLTDALSPAETASLMEMLARWWHRPILRLEVRHLWLLWARDDLVLDGAVAEEIPLTP